MNTMKTLTIVAVVAVLALLTGCGVFSQEQAAAIESVLREGLADGSITQTQFDAAIEALRAQTGPDWELIAAVGGNVLLTLLGVPIYLRRTSTRAQLEKMGADLPAVVAAAKAAKG